MDTSPAPAAWSVVHVHTLAARPKKVVAWRDLALSRATERYLASIAADGIYVHQEQAVRASVAGDDVCLATSTASGKTLAFHAAAIERLARDPAARILAVYPMKALGHEQEARWQRALDAAGIAGRAVRVDGSIRDKRQRLQACASARVIIATPDVLHAWLLPRMGQPGDDAVAAFLRRTSLVVVDEVHTYTGVCGTNAALLFRRLQHAIAILGGAVSFVVASATMRAPEDHLVKLFGRSFTLIGPEVDTSPRYPVDVVMVRPPGARDFQTELVELLSHLIKNGERFIAFFDCRKNTEQMGAAMLRGLEDSDVGDATDFGHLRGGQVLPYRAGYEADHRDMIQKRLTDGSLRGVLSTSALELGLDIEGLSVAVLVGAPASGTSLQQRIGRVGRRGPGTVLVVHSGTVLDDVVFANPASLMQRPLAETAIYLESERLQYIHAMALAGSGGEHERAHRAAGRCAPTGFTSVIPWPDGFVRLCEAEREGRVASHLREMKREADQQPTLAFPLRDAEQQFEVEVRRGLERIQLGSLSWAQVMREAYPGAIYYYTGRPYRVVAVDVRGRRVSVVPSKHYVTQPMPVTARLTPQAAVHRSRAHGELVLAECDLQIWRAVLGYRERRGQTVDHVRYPSKEWSREHFSRTLFTTGVCLAHPALDAQDVDIETLGQLLHEAFLAVVPLDRQDVEGASDVLRASWHPLTSGRRFLALYDQTYGSLRLSGRILDGDIIRQTLELVAHLACERDLIAGGLTPASAAATRRAATELAVAVRAEPLADVMGAVVGPEDHLVRVMLPRSRGRSARRPGFEFEVHGIFNRHDLGVCYRGVWVDIGKGSRSAAEVIAVHEIDGASAPVIWGHYDPDTGEASAEHGAGAGATAA
ncbi:MAG TPA: DEAD/DEAH box helicase [Minicystis sp.]|nr:DEAD/DEAH box helicase [Minicystis sp.]